MAVRLEIDPRTPLGYRLVSDDPSDPAQDEAGVVVGRAAITAFDAAPDLSPTARYDGLVRGSVLDESRVLVEVFEGGAWHPLPEIPDVSVDPWSPLNWYDEGAIVLEPAGAGWSMWRAGEYIGPQGTTPSSDARWAPIVSATLTALIDTVADLTARVIELERPGRGPKR